MMVTTDPQLYCKYVIKKCILFYKKLAMDLEKCVSNMIVNGSQKTMMGHVNYLKVSHKGPSEISKFTIYLYKIYGKITVHYGTIHDYLGMAIDFSIDGVSITDYTNNIIQEFPEEIDSIAAMPEANHVFEIEDRSKDCLLPEQ